MSKRGYLLTPSKTPECGVMTAMVSDLIFSFRGSQNLILSDLFLITNQLGPDANLYIFNKE